ncbi:MAG TPA: hypothetical protein VLC46_21555 [Thermoanaerobaculia bacterium]|jgi:hypothetical protein|nr:hypothetical protein [Thermoanaerobaculia bacterium]
MLAKDSTGNEGTLQLPPSLAACRVDEEDSSGSISGCGSRHRVVRLSSAVARKLRHLVATRSADRPAHRADGRPELAEAVTEVAQVGNRRPAPKGGSPLPLLVLVFALGCAPTSFTHPTKGPADYDHDYHACENQAAQVAANWGSRGNPFIIYDEIKKCMVLDYGWQVVNRSDAGPRQRTAPHPPPDPPPAPLSPDDAAKLLVAKSMPMGSTPAEVRAALGREGDGVDRSLIEGGHVEEVWTYKIGSATVRMTFVDEHLTAVGSR